MSNTRRPTLERARAIAAAKAAQQCANESSRTEPLGFVVLARRPNPWAQDPWDYWAIGKLYRTEARAITALAKGELAAEVEREAVTWRINQDTRPAHRHHRECIHNRTPEEQIVLRGRTVEWWRNVGAEWPKQIEFGHWEVEPKPDPVEYIVRPINEVETP